MGDLKPLGSEKLQGMEKIKRMLEISKFKENIPQPINETSKDQYRTTLADGNEYQIVREKAGYIIKKTISESVAEYIEPIKHRKYYTSYSQALKRLNLMAKETNVLHENEEGISLFEQKKFVLKTPKPAAAAPPPPAEEVENVPPPPPAPDASATPPPPPPPEGEMGGDMPPPPPEGEGEETPPPPPEEGEEMDMDNEDMGAEDEVVTFKSIQKLVGRLGQKLRTIGADEENQMSSKDIKYVINSVLSALDLNDLDEDDREQIINKFEGIEDEFADKEDMGSEEESGVSDEEGMGSEESIPPPPPPGEEMAEMTESGDFNHITGIADSLFRESKVDMILYNYFTKNKHEKKFDRLIKEERREKNIKKNKLLSSEIKRLSESVLQEVSARKLIQKFPSLKFIGKSNKNNLVFENSQFKQYKITPDGNII